MCDYSNPIGERTVGLDLGDRSSYLVVINAEGEVVESRRIATRSRALQRYFSRLGRCRVAQTGTHAGWVSRLLRDLGQDVIVANSRKLRLIYTNRRKDDRVDAEYLARLARADPTLLSPVQMRSEQVQADATLLESRKRLVESRTKLINHCRGTFKKLGYRLASCSSGSFARRVWEQGLPELLKPSLHPILETIAELSRQIAELDAVIESRCEREYPHTGVLRQIRGVGPITALTFALRVESAGRFVRSRQVGAFFGLTPARRQSGARDPELRITKSGDRMVRTLLVSCAHYILGPFGEDCDLRRWGERLVERRGGGKKARKVAVVAVARKLAVLMHHLWVTGEVYEPLHNAQMQAVA